MTQTKQTTSRPSAVTINDLAQAATASSLATATHLRDATEKLAEEFIDASLASHEAGTRASREYVGSLNNSRRQWIRETEELTEKARSISTAELDYPLKREIEEFNAGVIENTKRAFEFFTAPFLAAVKR